MQFLSRWRFFSPGFFMNEVFLSKHLFNLFFVPFVAHILNNLVGFCVSRFVEHYPKVSNIQLNICIESMYVCVVQWEKYAKVDHQRFGYWICKVKPSTEMAVIWNKEDYLFWTSDWIPFFSHNDLDGHTTLFPESQIESNECIFMNKKFYEQDITGFVTNEICWFFE